MIDLKLEPHDSAMLRIPAAEFDFSNPPYDPKDLALALARFMVDHGGYGLSGPQVGVPYRVFALRSSPNYVLFNPRVVALDGPEVEAIEGCLTFPGIGVSIKRRNQVRLRYQMPSGETDTQVLKGMSARVVQHEVDHLDGVLFFDRAKSRLDREYAMKKWIKRVREGRHVPRPLSVAEKAESTYGMMMALRNVDPKKVIEAEKA
jgi:peptide deformylase